MPRTHREPLILGTSAYARAPTIGYTHPTARDEIRVIRAMAPASGMSSRYVAFGIVTTLRQFVNGGRSLQHWEKDGSHEEGHAGGGHAGGAASMRGLG